MVIRTKTSVRTDDGPTHVELLVVPYCRHQTGAISLLQTTLDAMGLDEVIVDTTVIDTLAAAQQRKFIE